VEEGRRKILSAQNCFKGNHSWGCPEQQLRGEARKTIRKVGTDRGGEEKKGYAPSSPKGKDTWVMTWGGLLRGKERQTLLKFLLRIVNSGECETGVLKKKVTEKHRK